MKLINNKLYTYVYRCSKKINREIIVLYLTISSTLLDVLRTAWAFLEN